MTPYQWMGIGPICRTGSMLIVMKPTRPGLAVTAAIMGASGGGMHLEDAVPGLRSNPLHVVAETPQPGREGVGAEMPLHHQRRRRIGLEPSDPGEQQLVQRRLAEPHR